METILFILLLVLLALAANFVRQRRKEIKKKTYRPASKEMKASLGIREFRVPGVILLRWTWHPDLPLYFTFKFAGITIMTHNWHGWNARLIIKFLGKVIRR